MKDDEQIFDATWPSSTSMNCYLLTSLQKTIERSRYKSSPAYKTSLMPKVQLLSLYSERVGRAGANGGGVIFIQRKDSGGGGAYNFTHAY